MSNALAAIGEIERLATVMVKSKLFGVETVEQAMSLMMIADAEGRHPALAARDYHVIKGRPALKADAMLARFQQAGGVVSWTKYTESEVTGSFSHPQSSPTPIEITWTFEQAKKIGLTGKDNWRNYPRAMLRARVISEGVRTVYPGISVGVYTVEEVQDFTEKDVTPRNTPTSGAIDRVATDRLPLLDEVEGKVREWIASGSIGDAVCELDAHGLDADESVALWARFDSKQRAAMKKEETRQRAERKALPQPERDVTQDVPQTTADATHIPKSSTINEAQRVRLEAVIGDVGIQREKVKKYVKKTFSKDHFKDMNQAEYDALDGMLAAEKAKPLKDRIQACKTDADLHALTESMDEQTAAIYFDTVVAHKETLAKGAK